MERIELNILDLNVFSKQMDLADKNHIYYAKFVSDAEIFCKNERDEVIDENLTRYRRIWFDLEVINALALDDWESAGRPENWLPEWEAKYKDDVQEVIAELRGLLTNL